MVDRNIKRAPISVTFEELEDQVSETSKEAKDGAGNTNQAQLSTVDQILNENEQMLYGPLYNAHALQGYILLCCQVQCTAISGILRHLLICQILRAFVEIVWTFNVECEVKAYEAALASLRFLMCRMFLFAGTGRGSTR